MDHCMSVTKRAPLTVLTRQPDSQPLNGKAPHCQGLCSRPINWPLSICHSQASIKKFSNLRMRLESIWQNNQPTKKSLKFFKRHTCIYICCFFLPSTDIESPYASDIATVNIVISFCSRQFRIQTSPMFFGDPHRLVPRHLTESKQFFQIALMNTRLLLNNAVECRLRKCGLICFIMTTTPKTVHVDNDISLKFPSEVHGQANDLCYRFRIFTIHVEDWNLEHFCDIGCVNTGT